MRLLRKVSVPVERSQDDAVAEFQRALGGHEGLELTLYADELGIRGTLPAEDPIHLEIRRLIERYNLRGVIALYAEFSQADINGAELLVLRPDNYISQTPPSAAQYRTVTICPECGLRRRERIGPLSLSKAKSVTGKKWTKPLGDDAHLISIDLARLFDEWQVSGCRLQEVLSTKGGPLPVMQVVPQWLLPTKLHPSTPFKPGANLCSVCKQLGRYPLQLVYGRPAVGELHDIGLAPIHYSLDLPVASPAQLVVSQRLYRLMKGARVGGFVVEPVRLA